MLFYQLPSQPTEAADRILNLIHNEWKSRKNIFPASNGYSETMPLYNGLYNVTVKYDGQVHSAYQLNVTAAAGGAMEIAVD